MGIGDDNQIYIIEVMRGQWSPANAELEIMEAARWDGDETSIRLPKDPGGAGKFQATHFVGKLPAGRWSPKQRRATRRSRRSVAAQCEHGFVKLVEGDWNKAFIDELCAFPNGAYDDQVDAAAAAFRALTRRISWAAA